VPVNEVPVGPTTVTSTVPAECAGASTVSSVSESTVRFVPATPPKSTSVAPVKPLPSTTTPVSPDSGPAAGVTAVTAGGL
jgi:hypothetical protein